MDCNSVLSSRNKHTKVSNTIRKIGLGIATKARQGCESSVLEGVTLTPGLQAGIRPDACISPAHVSSEGGKRRRRHVHMNSHRWRSSYRPQQRHTSKFGPGRPSQSPQIWPATRRRGHARQRPFTAAPSLLLTTNKLNMEIQQLRLRQKEAMGKNQISRQQRINLDIWFRWKNYFV